MVTDPPPRARTRRAAFERSDRLHSLELPDRGALSSAGRSIEEAMAAEDRAGVQRACQALADLVAEQLGVEPPTIEVYEARPKRRRRGWDEELFGDYDLDSGVIRVWMRTAVRKKVTSFGTLLSTLCHEIAHHLDLHLLGLPDTPHTRGFYARTAQLYHAARATPIKPLAWTARPNGSWQVDWRAMRRGAR